MIGPGQSITERLLVPLNFFPVAPYLCSALFAVASSFLLLRSTVYKSTQSTPRRCPSPEGRRVAWPEIKHIHHHPYAVSADKQALNNVMKPPFVFRVSMDPRYAGPSPRNNGNGHEMETRLSCFDALVVDAGPATIPRSLRFCSMKFTSHFGSKRFLSFVSVFIIFEGISPRKCSAMNNAFSSIYRFTARWKIHTGFLIKQIKTRDRHRGFGENALSVRRDGRAWSRFDESMNHEPAEREP